MLINRCARTVIPKKSIVRLLQAGEVSFQMSVGNWGGSAAGGGLEFQSAVSALCMVHMACGMSLGWSASGKDTPLSVSAETGGAGDDIAMTLADGDTLEVQAKRRLTARPELWESLIALCRRAHEDVAFYGVLAVGPTTSIAIRDQLARDIIRIGQGRMDDLSPLAMTLVKMLSSASIPLSACGRVRIQTVHVLEQDGASVQSAVAYLSHISTLPSQAWEQMKAEGLRLIKLRGRLDTISVAGIIPGLRAVTSGLVCPAVVATQLLDWTLTTTRTFTIPAVDKEFSLDDDWIKLKVYGQDTREVSLGSLAEALTRYHENSSGVGNGRGHNLFDAESVGYFVKHCVVVAGPGMGKTQLLRKIARLLARKKEPSLFVRLRPLAQRMRFGDTFLEAVLHIGLDTSPLGPQDVRTLGMENLTLLLDGLDESGSEQEEIAKAAAALTMTYPGCRIVFTTRPIGYETARLNTWRHYEIAQIESSIAKRAVESLVNAVAVDGNAKIKESTAAATGHLDYNRAYKFSAGSPLMVALLTSLALNEVIAAATREGLYGQLFKLIERMAAAQHEGIKATATVLNAFLQQLGWELNAHPYTDAELILAACAQRLSVELGERPLKARSICDESLAFWEKAGIVERVRFKFSETLTFSHKTFGEYAAAKYLMSRNADERLQLLQVIEPVQQWNEVVVFSSAMGLGFDLVQLALVRTHKNTIEIDRILRWASHSKDKLKPDLAEKVLQQAWAVIVAPHSRQALNTGVELVAALDKLPSPVIESQAFLEHNQWWTALVGWACFVKSNPELLDFSALLIFMQVYAEGADTRNLSGGFVLHNSARDLWDELLLSSAREALRRGIDAEEQKFIDRLKESLGTRSMSFGGKLASIFKGTDIDIKLPGRESLSIKYFTPEFREQSRRDDLALLSAIADGFPDLAVPVKRPLLHLSAFWYGTGLMKMELSALTLAAQTSDNGEARQIVKLAARLSAYDYKQLIAEARTKIQELEEDADAWAYDGLLSVDASIKWRGKPDSIAMPLIYKALLHPSEWIVSLGYNLATHVLKETDIAELVPKVIRESNGVGTAAAADLAVHFLSKECARELILARLQQPLNNGSQYLFSSLSEIWTPDLDNQIVEIITPSLSFGPRTAKAALSLVKECGKRHRKELIPLLKHIYDYWFENERQCSTESGTIPESPRGDILALLIEEEEVNHDDLFEAAKDHRMEVSKLAINTLQALMSRSELVRNKMLGRLHAGEQLETLLIACLKARTPFSEQEVHLIAKLLESEKPETRYAATGILDIQYLPPSEIGKWADKLQFDPYQHLRDKGVNCLTICKSRPI